MNPLPNVVAYALAAALAAALLAVGLLWMENNRLEKKLDVCTDERATAISRLDVQNAAVDDLKRRADAAQAEAASAAERAAAAEKASRSRVQARQAAIATPSEGKTCGDAMRAIREGLRP